MSFAMAASGAKYPVVVDFEELSQLRRDAAQTAALRADVDRLMKENAAVEVRLQTFSCQNHMIINKLKEIINGQEKKIEELDGQLNFFQTKSSAMSGWCKDYKERSEMLEGENDELRKVIEEWKKSSPSTSPDASSSEVICITPPSTSSQMPPFNLRKVDSLTGPLAVSEGLEKIKRDLLRSARSSESELRPEPNQRPIYTRSELLATLSEIPKAPESSEKAPPVKKTSPRKETSPIKKPATSPKKISPLIQKPPAPPARAESPEITEIAVVTTINGTPPVKTFQQIQKEWKEDKTRDKELNQSHFAVYLFNPNGAYEAPQLVRKLHSAYTLYVQWRICFRNESGQKLSNHYEGWNVLGKTGQRIWKDRLGKVVEEQHRQVSKGWIQLKTAEKRKQNVPNVVSRRVKTEPIDDY